ncbi:MAG: aminoglycoside 6-adenylyltransferase [Ginsengibacter sp.]
MPTYSSLDIEENWKSLFLMTEIFEQTSNFIAEKSGLRINNLEQQNTSTYLQELFKNQQK